MDMTGVELAHDLRMPLQLISSSAQMLKLSMDDPTLDTDAYVDILMQSVEHMRRMLDGTLERCGRAVRQELPRPVNADLATCIRQLCLRCRPFAEQGGVRLSCHGNVASLRMALDEDMLCRVLLNLISNALRFTSRGGEVRVTWRALGDFVEICVSDDGAGIPPERLPYVFRRGESDGGYGYGLPIALRLARAMGGDLTASSQRGQGSAFTLRLPVRAARAV
jgi:signal transduction histidine kinase